MPPNEPRARQLFDPPVPRRPTGGTVMAADGGPLNREESLPC